MGFGKRRPCGTSTSGTPIIPPPPPPPPPPQPTSVLTSIVLSPSSAGLMVGQAQTLSIVGKDQFGLGFALPALTVNIGNTSILSSGPVISSQIVLTALAAGSTTVSVTGGGKTSNTVPFTVSAVVTPPPPPPPPVEEVRLVPTSASVQAGSSLTFTAQFYSDGLPVGGKTYTIFSNSNPSKIGAVITSAGGGTISGLSAGTGNIVVAVGSVHSAPLTVTVTALPIVLVPTSIVVTPSTLAPLVGATISIAAQVRDQFGVALAGAGRTVTWSDVLGSGGTFASPTSPTNSSGIATVNFTVSSTPAIVHQIKAQVSSTVSGLSSDITTQIIADSDTSVVMRARREDGLSTTLRAALALPVPNDPRYTAGNMFVTIGDVEQPILPPVLQGQYVGGAALSLYTELDIGGADNTVEVIVHFGRGPRTLTPLVGRVHCANAQAGWEDPVSHELPDYMMANPRRLGHAPICVIATDPDYLTTCGVFGQLLKASAIPSIPGINFQRANKYNTMYDQFIRDYHWNGYPTAALFITNTNTNWNGQDLTSPLRGIEDIPSFSGEIPPRFAPWRAAAGLVGFGGGQNYYGADRISFLRYLMTGDWEHFVRACYYAETCRHFHRWGVHREGTIGYVTGNEVSPGAIQIEGFGFAYLLTGNGAMFDLLKRLNDFHEAAQLNPATPTWFRVGGADSDLGEPRPMGRIGDLYNWTAKCSRPGDPYPARVEAHYNRVYFGTAFTKWQDATIWPIEKDLWTSTSGAVCPPGAAANPPKPGINTFMEPINADAGVKALDQFSGWLSPTLQARMKFVHKAVVDKLKSTFWRAPRTGYLWSFVNGFTDGVVGACAFPGDYSDVPDLNNMFTLLIAAVARDTQDPVYTAFWHTVFNDAVGPVDGAYDGTNGPFVYALKASREQFCESLWSFYPLTQAPVP